MIGSKGCVSKKCVSCNCSCKTTEWHDCEICTVCKPDDDHTRKKS